MKKPSLKSGNERIWELDFLKGIALVMMIFDHAVFDLSDVFGVDTSSMGFFQNGIGEICAIIFITVCGISLTVGKRNLTHALKLMLLSLALSAVTAVLERVTGFEVTIRFGILHFLAVGIFIGHFAKRLPSLINLILAAVSLSAGGWFSSLRIGTDIFFPLGLRTQDFYSADYFPVFPFIGFILIGIVIGKRLYKKKKSLLGKMPGLFRPVCFLGRHTLILYFVHQPLVLGVLYLILGNPVS